jgi:hypothetical protein
MNRCEQLFEIGADRFGLMRDYSIWASSFGYPSSSHNEAVGRTVRDVGYTNARETGSLGNAPVERLPPNLPDPYQVRLNGSVKNPNVGLMKGWVEDARRAGGGWVWVSFHGITKGSASGYETKYSVLDEYLGWLADQQRQGKLVVKTADQVMGQRLAPAKSHCEVAAAHGNNCNFDDCDDTPPPPPPPGCLVGNGSFVSKSMPAQSATFTAEADVTPLGEGIDAALALSNGAQTRWSGLAAIVLFNRQGQIVARNGAAYQATTPISYTPNTKYHVRLVVNVAAHTYDVHVTSPGQPERLLASGFGFRSEQNSISTLNNWVVASTSGSALQACELGLQ